VKQPEKPEKRLIAIALALAMISYFYMNYSLKSDKSRIQDQSYKLLRMTAKRVPVKVRFAATPPQGYRLDIDRVVTNPKEVMIIGPDALLSEKVSAETAIIDVSQTTRKTTKAIPLESVAGIHLAGEPNLVEVTIPVEKLGSDR
jgi:hypothetical protein